MSINLQELNENAAIRECAESFKISFKEISQAYDSSQAADDFRLNLILDQDYVLKINSHSSMNEKRLKGIKRLIKRYRSIGVYCPDLIFLKNGRDLSREFKWQGQNCRAYLEEFARYPLLPADKEIARSEVIAHLGKLASKFSSIDLWQDRSVWSIIELSPWDNLVDEKQENTDLLIEALNKVECQRTAAELKARNVAWRSKILKDFADLPRSVFQGDLNNSNILHDHGHFAGLIDFNLAGTEVNINVFANECKYFPDSEECAKLSAEQILEKMRQTREELLAIVFKDYKLSDAEKHALPYYIAIADLFQWPNVCLYIKWLESEKERPKALKIIKALCFACD